MALLDEYIDNGFNEGFDDTPGFLRNPEENADFLLRGLTRAGQDAMARDVFSKLSKKASRHKAFRSDKIDPEGGFVVKVGSEPAYNGGEDIFEAYKNMPEDVGDSFLLTAMSTPTRFNPREGSLYNMLNGNVQIGNPNKYLSSAGSIAHEYGHATMARLHPSFPKKVKYVKDFNEHVFNSLPHDVSVDENIGRLMENDYIINFPAYDKDNPNTAVELDRKIRSDVLDPHFAKGERFLGADLANTIDDAVKLAPRSKIEFDSSNPHDANYKNTKKLAFYGQNGDVAKSVFAPMSMEGTANLFRIMSNPNGAKWVEQNMPNTYKKIIELMQNDHRKKTFRAPKKYKEIK